MKRLAVWHCCCTFSLLFEKIVEIFSYIINRILGGEEIVDIFLHFRHMYTKTHYGRGNFQDFILTICYSKIYSDLIILLYDVYPLFCNKKNNQYHRLLKLLVQFACPSYIVRAKY